MTCKDCVHYEVCRHFVDLINPLLADHNRIDINENTDICKEHFQDHSRFVELPCEAFTIVFGKVSAGRIDSANILLKNSTAWTFDSSHIGKEIFFTREEAEQALKEREV